MKKRVWLLIGLWIVGIIFPMAWFTNLSPVLHVWFECIFSPPWMHIVMHAGLYAVLTVGLCFALGRFRRKKFVILGIVLLVGLLQEVFQTLFAGRSLGFGELFDLGIDMLGACAGLLFFYGIINKFVGKNRNFMAD